MVGPDNSLQPKHYRAALAPTAKCKHWEVKFPWRSSRVSTDQGSLRLRMLRRGPDYLAMRSDRRGAVHLDECVGRCSGRDPWRQRPLSKAELASLSESARRYFKLSGQAAISAATAAASNPRSTVKIRLGSLDGIAGSGWHSRELP